MSTCGCNFSSDYDPYIPPSGGGCGCGNSGCNGGCGHSNCCGPTIPCDNSVPETCAPLPVTTQAARLVVENGNACKRTLQTPLNSVLITGADGRPQWANGSSTQEICLPDLQVQDSGITNGIWAVNEGGCLREFRPLIGGSNPALQVLRGTNTGDVYWDADDAGLPSTCGLFYRNCDTDVITTLTGNPGQVVGFNSDGTPVAQPFNSGADPTQALFAKTNAGGATMPISAQLLSVFNGSAWITLTNINLTLRLDSVGPNALDAGVASTGTLYWMYVIYNPQASTVAAIASLNPSAPTLPTNYTYYRKIGALVTKIGIATEAITFHQAMEKAQFGIIGDAYPNAVIPGQSGIAATGSFTLTPGILAQYVKAYTGQIRVNKEIADAGLLSFSFFTDGQSTDNQSIGYAATAADVTLLMRWGCLTAPGSGVNVTINGEFGGATVDVVQNGVEWNFTG